MRSVSVSKYWFFGTSVRYLQDVSEGTGIHGDGYILGNIERLFEHFEDLGLRVTERAATELRNILAEYKKLPANSKLTDEQATKLRKTVNDLRKTLEAEIEGVEAFVVSSKRVDPEKLIQDVASLFAPDVFDSLSSVAQYDITEAGKCIAFERPTAAAFHLMRATEATLRDFYCYFVKRDRIDPLLWHPMVQALQKHRRAKVHDVLLRNLDNMRLSFRNPTQHPDKIYDIQEIQDLWGLSVDAINRMQRCVME